MTTRVTIWHEFRHEKHYEEVRAIYPDGMHAELARGLHENGLSDVRLAAQDDPEHGLTDEVLASTDVLTWWGHGHHADVDDAIVSKVYDRVHAGMGLVVLHSGHHSKIFRKLMGTSGNLKWRVARGTEQKEVLWVVKPGHPILAGVDDHFVLPEEEMYGEHFDVPEPDELLLISSFTGGEVFRSGMTWQRGAGKVFYFRPGHETYPTYKNATVRRVIANGVRWCAPVDGGKVAPGCPNPPMGWV
ncbi:MAG TPA: ThuA domain-containing protein [Tepidisphaeraceae bacterium]|jgi:trehalose utilization protein